MKTIGLVAPQYREAATSFPSFDYDPAQLPAIRNALIEAYEQRYGPTNSIHKEEIMIPSKDGSPAVRSLLYRPEMQAKNGAAILHIHGGGWIAGSADMMAGFCADLARRQNVLVLSVDYRLAPETVEPGPMNDCYAAMQWLFANAESLGVDARRIAIMGDSAGGGLAAGLALRVRDEARYVLKAAFLIYPALDRRTATLEASTENPTTGEFVVSRKYARQIWQARLGATPLTFAQQEYFSPASARNLEGLSPTFIAVGSLDLFSDEDIEYALRLSNAGVGYELHVYDGVFHAFDLIPGDVTDQFTQDLTRAVKRLLVEA